MELFEQLKSEEDNWIRFELGLVKLDDEAYFKEVHHRAKSILNEMHGENDTISLVAFVHNRVDARKIELPRIKPMLRNKKLIYRLTCEKIPLLADPENIEMKTTQYSLTVKKEDLYLDYILKNPRMNQELYIVNVTRRTLFYMYDYRGCDVYSLEKDDLLPIYYKFRRWILDENRIEIDRSFERGLFQHVETPLELEQREKINEQRVKETKINLYENNICHITHKLEIPKEYANECIVEMSQTGFKIEVEEESVDVIILIVMKTEALAIIDYQTELMSLYAKKYRSNYMGWSIVKAF